MLWTTRLPGWRSRRYRKAPGSPGQRGPLASGSPPSPLPWKTKTQNATSGAPSSPFVPSPPKRPLGAFDAPPSEEVWPLRLAAQRCRTCGGRGIASFLGSYRHPRPVHLGYVLVLLPVGALLYGLLALAADLMVLSLLFLGSTPGP